MEEQRKAGQLLDDGSLCGGGGWEGGAGGGTGTVFAHDGVAKRRAPLVRLNFSSPESAEKMCERLLRVRESVPKDKEGLFKCEVRWDGSTDMMIDRKLEPLIKRLMVKYLDEEEDDLIMFVVEHLKDRKSPGKLIEGLYAVLEAEAVELVFSVWRQIVFESMAYNEGLLTEKMLVD